MTASNAQKKGTTHSELGTSIITVVQIRNWQTMGCKRNNTVATVLTAKVKMKLCIKSTVSDDDDT